MQYRCIGVEYLTCNGEVASSTHTRSTVSASNLEQVANLLCAQANSVSYPQRYAVLVSNRNSLERRSGPSINFCSYACQCYNGDNCTAVTLNSLHCGPCAVASPGFSASGNSACSRNQEEITEINTQETVNLWLEVERENVRCLPPPTIMPN